MSYTLAAAVSNPIFSLAAAFAKYQNEGRSEGNLLARLAGEGTALPGTDGGDDSDSDNEFNFDGDDNPLTIVDAILQQQAFDWTDTTDMTQYDCDPYEKYSNKFGNRIFAMASGIGKQLTRMTSLALDAAGF